MENRFWVFSKDDTGKYNLFFDCKECSTYCSRNCCQPWDRYYVMKVNLIRDPISPPDFTSENSFAALNREYYCTCCSSNRPVLTCHYGNIKNPIFGSIIEPFTCCDCSPWIHVRNKLNEVIFTINTICCQCGISCRHCCCGPFYDVKLFIGRGPGDPKINPCGFIHKPKTGCQGVFTNADNFEIEFPKDATAEEKLLLIFATLFMDYQYFEEPKNSN